MKKYGFIYITTNNINGKKYIGQRKIAGNSTDESYIGSGVAFLEAVKMYGKENFTREIICYAYSQEELDSLEEAIIAEHNATQSSEYYNIHAGGKGGSKFAGWSEERLEEYKKLKSEKSSGENNPRYGVKCSDETREKIRQARLNSKSETFQSKEFLDKMSEVTSGGNNGMYGRKHSEESKRKMSENSKGLTSGSKNGNYGCKGEKAKNGKTVYKYADKEHKVLVKRYNTVRLVLEEYEIKGHAGLMKAIKNNTEYKGYYWSKTLDV